MPARLMTARNPWPGLRGEYATGRPGCRSCVWSRATRPRPHHHTTSEPLLSADSESHSGADVCPQRRVSHDFLIGLAEGIFEIYIGRDAGSEGRPSTEVHACVPGRVVDAVAEKIGIRASPDETSAQVCSPTGAQICQQQTARMLGTTDQGLAGLEQRIESKRLLQNLRRSVGVGAIERQLGQRPSVKLHLRPVRQCLIHIDILTAEGAGWRTGGPGQEVEIDLVTKQAVEVRSCQRVIPGKLLFHASFEGARLLRLEVWIGNHRKAAAIPE